MSTLYRVYRPKVFADVVGQEQIVTSLSNQLKAGKVSHAYLFCGTRGTGKTSIAKIFSRAVNCQNPASDGSPCNECDVCKGLLNNTLLDVIEMDAASNRSIDDIRQLREEIAYAPSLAKYKVYIIDEVHMLTKEAFNALLKTLEEPPAHAVFILATTEVNKVPITIQSRCQRFDFKRISSSDIAKNILKISKLDNFHIEEDAAELLGNLADGAMRDALSMLEAVLGEDRKVTVEKIQKTLGIASRDKYFDLADAIIDKNIENVLKLSKELMATSGDAANLVNGLTEHFRNLVAAKAIGDAGEYLEVQKVVADKYKTQAEKIQSENLIKTLQKLCNIIYMGKSAGMTSYLAEAGILSLL